MSRQVTCDKCGMSMGDSKEANSQYTSKMRIGENVYIIVTTISAAVGYDRPDICKKCVCLNLQAELDEH